MLSCLHSEADALGPICIGCGRVSFDPSWFILAASVAFGVAQSVRLFL